MFRSSIALFLLALLVGCAPAAEQAEVESHEEEPTAMQEELPAVIAELRASEELFHGMMQYLTEEQWNYRESPERWSIAGVAEHLIISEQSLGALVRDQVLATEMSEPQASPDSLDEMVMAMMLDRSQTFPAPDDAQPTGAYTTPEAALEAFHEARRTNIEAAEANLAMLRHHQMDHPIGVTLDAEQWLIFISAHTRRHLAQAQQVKDHEGYPSE